MKTVAPAGMRRAYLVFEFTLLFIVLPTIYSRFRLAVHPLPLLWFVAAFSLYLLKRDGYFGKCRFCFNKPTGKQIILVLLRFVILAALITLFTIVYDPANFLSFPGNRRALWLTVLVLYPFLSAIPQGIIYRAFLCHRYRELFGNGWIMIAVGGLVFCYAHIIYQNPFAVVMALAGGIMFVQTYLKSSSFWFSSMEHALYGNFIFTIGLGHYIFSGALLN